MQNADAPAALHHAAGFHTFPVRLDKEKGRKIPLRKSWNTEPIAELPTNSPQWGARIPEGWCVVDVDTKRYNGKQAVGAESFEKLKAYLQKALPDDLYTVQTMTGGFHHYFRVPPSINIAKKNELFPNIEFLTAGDYVVGPGTDFDIEKSLPYTVLNGTMSPDYNVQMPQEWLAYVTVEESQNALAREAHEYSNDAHVVAQVTEYLKRIPAAIEGSNGDTYTYEVACFGHERGLTPQKMLDLMYDLWNPRCQPVWKYEELALKVENAYKYAKNGPGSQNYAHLMNPMTDENQEDMLYASKPEGVVWPRNANGAFLSNNEDIVINFLTTQSFDSFRNGLWNIFRFNEFTKNVEYCRTPPWADPWVARENDPKHINSVVDDDEISRIRRYLSQRFHYNARREVVEQAVWHVAKRMPYHPVKMWLKSLRWDGVKRLEHWGPVYLDCPNDPYHRRVTRLWLMGAVQRILKPGCKWDYVPVLEGPQGCGKSRTCRILARRPEWFASITPDTDKDTKMVMIKKWIIELAEIDSLSKKEASQTKAFIDNEVDTMRLPYGRSVGDFPRHSIFIGTVNPNASGQYLNDSTGGRRYWPIECGTIDHEGLEENIDQLYAEAYHEATQPQNRFYLDSDTESAAKLVQKKRLQADPFVEMVEDYWRRHPEVDGVQLSDLYVEMGGAMSHYNAKTRKRLIDTADYLGCKLDGQAKNTMRPPGYAPLEPLQEMYKNLHARIRAIRSQLKAPVQMTIETLAMRLSGDLDFQLERAAKISLGSKLSRVSGVERGRNSTNRFWTLYPLEVGEK